MLEIITSLLEGIGGYIGGTLFKDGQYTYKKIMMVALLISTTFFLTYSLYEIIFGDKKFIKLSFIISGILFIGIIIIFSIFKFLAEPKK